MYARKVICSSFLTLVWVFSASSYASDYPCSMLKGRPVVITSPDLPGYKIVATGSDDPSVDYLPLQFKLVHNGVTTVLGQGKANVCDASGVSLLAGYYTAPDPNKIQLQINGAKGHDTGSAFIFGQGSSLELIYNNKIWIKVRNFSVKYG